MKLKYIIVLHDSFKVPVVFSELIPHHEVAGNQQILSAGYCSKDCTGRWITGGRSESLTAKAMQGDAEILNTFL